MAERGNTVRIVAGRGATKFENVPRNIAADLLGKFQEDIRCFVDTTAIRRIAEMPRRSLDGDKLAADIARLRAADKEAPPAACPSLMDAVREFAGFIETRTTLGWTDRMIAAVLTEAGYPIDAATLRSYRKRMGDEGLIQPRPKRTQKPVPDAVLPKSTTTLRQQAPAEAQAAAVPAVVTPQLPAKMPLTNAPPVARGPPEEAPSKRPGFLVSQKIMPSNEA